MRKTAPDSGEPTNVEPTNVEPTNAKPTDGPLVATLTASVGDFENLEAEWNDLYSNSKNTTPFQSWGWLFSWWQAYATPDPSKKLALLSFRERATGLLVGVFPMMVKRSLGGVGVLALVGDGVTDYLDVVVRSGWEREVFELGGRAVQEVPGWAVGNFGPLREGSAAFGILDRLGGGVSYFSEGNELSLRTNGWDQMLAPLGRKRRETARRTLRKADRAGLTVRPADPENLSEAARRWIELHHAYWQGRDISTEHLTPRFVSLVEKAVVRMSRAGVGRLDEFVLDGEVVAADFLLLGHDFVSGYLEGADLKALRGYELNTLYVRNWAEAAERANIPNVSFMVGEENYKLKWNPDLIPVRRAVFGRVGYLHRLFTAYLALRHLVISRLKDSDAPTPVRGLAHTLGTARSEVRKFRARRAKLSLDRRSSVEPTNVEPTNVEPTNAKPTDGPLVATLTASVEDFENLEAEWNDLYSNSKNTTPFQSWGWLFSWWQAYATPDPSKKLALLSFRERATGLLVGVFPMMVKRSLGGVGVLALVGDGVTDYLDVVVRSGWEREVFELGGRAVQEVPGWAVGDFRQLRPDASVFGVLDKLDRKPERLVEKGYPRIVASDWEAAVRGASKNLRSMARRSVKRLAADGVERVCIPTDAPPHRIADAARRFVTLHREYWRDRNISPEHLTGRFENHMVLSAGRMVPEGGMEIREFRLKGEVAASQIVMVGDRYAGQMLSGAGDKAAKRYQLSSLFIYDGFTVSERVGAEGFDLLRGEEAYKLRWNPEVVPGARAVFGRSETLRWGYLTGVKAYAALRDQAHAEDALPGVKRLFAVYTALRSRLARRINRG